MIKLEKVETFGWGAALRGMRNPLQSWNKSESKADEKLMCNLVKAGASHRKFLRQIVIYVDITANLKWWDEYDTYLHTVKNSTSQMHTITKREFKTSHFSNKISSPLAITTLKLQIIALNILRERYLKTKEKDIWRDIIELIPQSFLYTRTVMLNYEVFLAQYKERKNHKMSEWVEYCEILRCELPMMDEFIKTLEK